MYGNPLKSFQPKTSELYGTSYGLPQFKFGNHLRFATVELERQLVSKEK